MLKINFLWGRVGVDELVDGVEEFEVEGEEVVL